MAVHPDQLGRPGRPGADGGDLPRERLAQVEIFPDTLRSHLTDEVRKFAQRAQQSMEDSAKGDRSGRLLVLLRNNPLPRYEPATPDPSAEVPAAKAVMVSAQAPLTQAGVRRRNIIL